MQDGTVSGELRQGKREVTNGVGTGTVVRHCGTVGRARERPSRAIRDTAHLVQHGNRPQPQALRGTSDQPTSGVRQCLKRRFNQCTDRRSVMPCVGWCCSPRQLAAARRARQPATAWWAGAPLPRRLLTREARWHLPAVTRSECRHGKPAAALRRRLRLVCVHAVA
jgi:hypothetical protein